MIKLKVKSRNGIYYILKQSDYTVVYGALTFYFSSQNYRDRFNEEVIEAVDLYNARQAARTGIRSAAIFTPAFELYRRIEKRGFFVVLEWLGRRYELEEPGDITIADIPEVIFNGENL